MAIRHHRDSDSDGVTVIQRRFDDAIGSLSGFTDRELVPHTDGSAARSPARVLMLACVSQPSTGGQIALVDGCGLFQEIARTNTAMLDALSAPDAARFGGPKGHLGPVFEVAVGRVAIRLRFDDLIRYSPDAAQYVGRLREMVHRRTITLNLAVGEGYALLNQWWLHGRRRFTGERTMLRLIGDTLPDRQLPVGFPASDALSTADRLLWIIDPLAALSRKQELVLPHDGTDPAAAASTGSPTASA
jgi:hypothetical protein